MKKKRFIKIQSHLHWWFFNIKPFRNWKALKIHVCSLFCQKQDCYNTRRTNMFPGMKNTYWVACFWYFVAIQILVYQWLNLWRLRALKDSSPIVFSIYIKVMFTTYFNFTLFYFLWKYLRNKFTSLLFEKIS